MFQPLALPSNRVASKLHERIFARSGRNMDRGRAAAAAVRQAGGSAMDAALAQLGAAFDRASRLNDRHLQILDWIRRGLDDRAVRARFGARARMIAGLSVDDAIAVVDRQYRHEQKVFEIAGRNRLPLDILRELRFLLRLARRRLTEEQFHAIIRAAAVGASANVRENIT